MTLSLSDEEIQIIEYAYRFGGYIRVVNLQLLYPNMSHKSVYMKLEKLVMKGYLNKKKFITNSRLEPNTYQITSLTCKYFNNPDSYFRKKHNPEYAYRALMKNYFCLEYIDRFGSAIVSDNMEKIQLFSRHNFNSDLYPTKTNKGSSFIHFEELQIDFTEKHGQSLVGESDDLLYNDSNMQVIITYFDRYFVEPRKQVVGLVNRYINLMGKGDFDINFLIVCDSQRRIEVYNKVINNFLKRNKTVDHISDEMLDIYSKIYSYLLGFVDKNEQEIFLEKHQSGVLKKEYVRLFSDDYRYSLGTDDLDLIAVLQEKQFGYFEEYKTDVIEQFKQVASMNSDELLHRFVYDNVKQHFEKLLYYEYCNYIYFGKSKLLNNYFIKTYCVNQKFYID